MPAMWADDGTGIPECRERPLPLGSPPQATSDDLRRRSHRQPALDLGPARRAGCTMPCLPVRSVHLPWLTTRLADMPLADSGMSGCYVARSCLASLISSGTVVRVRAIKPRKGARAGTMARVTCKSSPHASSAPCLLY